MSKHQQWAIKQHIEKNPTCEWLCTHNDLENLGEEKVMSSKELSTEEQFKLKCDADTLESLWKTSCEYTDPWLHMAKLLHERDKALLETVIGEDTRELEVFGDGDDKLMTALMTGYNNRGFVCRERASNYLKEK